MFTAIISILALLAIAVAIILFIASRKPDEFRVSRSVTIKAPPGKIFPWFDTPRSMNVWNPFVKADPAIRIDYSGPGSGAGAMCTWEGNSQVGKGYVEVLETTPFSRIVVGLHMIKPLRADNRVEYTFTPRGDATEATWSMSGRQSLLAKVMTVFIDCDRMVGGQFEKGLAEVKALAEKQP